MEMLKRNFIISLILIIGSITIYDNTQLPVELDMILFSSGMLGIFIILVSLIIYLIRGE